MRGDMTISIQPDGDMFVAHCVDLDIASQGHSEDEARSNLEEAVALFLELASPAEIQARLSRPMPD